MDHFDYPSTAHVQRSHSITSIPEEDDAPKVSTPDINTLPDTKSSPYLRPPEQRFGKRNVSDTLSLHLDTSDGTLVASREGSIPSSPLEFRDIQEDGPLSSSHRSRSRWWPYLFPEPYFLFITLFPTVRGFRSKPWLHKILSIIAIPAVFCLTITLPVVDTESAEIEGEIKLSSALPSPGLLLSPLHDGSSDIGIFSREDDQVFVPRAWNRWLTGVQCIFTPIFLTFIFFRMHFSLQSLLIEDDGLRPMLYALLSGFIALAFLLTFSSPDKPPKWHKALCPIGFIVAIGWISTIADEVVGILRAFGAIVGVSEAILGVTVFAMVLSSSSQSHHRETHYRILWPT